MALIRISGLSKSFGEVVAVDKVTKEIAEGSFLSFLGPSGCGKTTMLSSLFKGSYEAVEYPFIIEPVKADIFYFSLSIFKRFGFHISRCYRSSGSEPKLPICVRNLG